MSSAITVYLAVFDRDGNLRHSSRQRLHRLPIHLSAIGMSSPHRPNARSQLTHYGMRHYKGRQRRAAAAAMRNLGASL